MVRRQAEAGDRPSTDETYPGWPCGWLTTSKENRPGDITDCLSTGSCGIACEGIGSWEEHSRASQDLAGRLRSLC